MFRGYQTTIEIARTKHSYGLALLLQKGHISKPSSEVYWVLFIILCLSVQLPELRKDLILFPFFSLSVSF